MIHSGFVYHVSLNRFCRWLKIYLVYHVTNTKQVTSIQFRGSDFYSNWILVCFSKQLLNSNTKQIIGRKALLLHIHPFLSSGCCKISLTTSLGPLRKVDIWKVKTPQNIHLNTTLSVNENEEAKPLFKSPLRLEPLWCIPKLVTWDFGDRFLVFPLFTLKN